MKKSIYNPTVSQIACREYTPFPSTNPNADGLFNVTKTLDFLNEEGHFFVSHWIPKGAFNDFRDGTTASEALWDNVQGYTVQQMWQVFDPTIWTDWEYKNKMVNMYGANDNAVNWIFKENKSH